MKISIVADIINAVFSNGKPQPSAKKLDREDFYQFSLASAGSIIRDTYYEERSLNNGDVTSFLSSMVEIKEVEIKKGGLGNKTLEIDVLTLPKNLGILNIYPLIKSDNGTICEVDYKNPFIRIQPGSAALYDFDDLGINAFHQRGVKPVLFCPDDMSDVAIEGVFRSDDFDVPEDIARKIINDVLSTVLKVAGFPADMTDDGNPNVKLVNDKIASAQIG